MKANEKSEIPFEFTWTALKLLGKTLYSNAWSAISELVANGFDAQAKNVYVFLDVADKRRAVIEIVDDGVGMSRDDLNTYVKIGYDKRLALKEKNRNADTSMLMGRKGIGKLAALYLSPRYYVMTKKGGGAIENWEMKYDLSKISQNDNPSLKRCSERIALCADVKWRETLTGTAIKMCDADLRGLGDEAFAALNDKLAHHFSLESMVGRKIYLCVRRSASEKIQFSPVKKNIAFGNMAFIECLLDDNKLKDRLWGRSLLLDQKLKCIPDEPFIHRLEVHDYEQEDHEYKGVGVSGEMVTKKVQLRGWIGIHCTINEKEGRANDTLFRRNKFYNPNQLRLYVRNKLAVENFLNILNSTKTYANYIEGEIHFDILDDDEFPDIATSNRQGIDEHDERVALLKKLVQPIVAKLISDREKLAKKINEIAVRRTNQIKTAAKAQFASEVRDELSKEKGLTPSAKSELAMTIVNKIQGDVLPKNKYVLFFSHAGVDSIFCNFLYNFLLERGVSRNEVFYTSRDNDPDTYKELKPLQDQIHDCIVCDNTKLFYMTGHGFRKSEYCLFEGGAGWATRSIGEYLILAVSHEHIPPFLTNGKFEAGLMEQGKILLSRKNYQTIVSLLNEMIVHINDGRRISGAKEVPLIIERLIPDLHVLKREHKTERDYMNKELVEMWEVYVQDALPQYIKEMKAKKTN